MSMSVKTCPCGRVLKIAGDDREVACGCGRRFRIQRRIRGAGPLRGLLRESRRALAAMPEACRRCDGTGLADPDASERAALLADARDVRPARPRPCATCDGSGRTAKKRGGRRG